MKTMVVLPDELGAELKRMIPTRSRSRFIAETVSDRLKKMRFQISLRKVAGAWTDRNHPDLKTQADVNRYLGRFRSRLKRPA